MCCVPVSHSTPFLSSSVFFFFNDTATTEIYTLSLHDALPIWMLGDVEVQDASTAVADDEEAIEHAKVDRWRSEEHTSELQHTVISYAVFCLKKKKKKKKNT